jgi:uncharacterized membrane protein
MSHPFKRPTRSARRRIALTLLVVLAVVGGSAYAVYAATKSDFSLSAAPSSQTVNQGSSTSYTVSLSRTGGFVGAVSLTASGLPAGATASFSPSSLVSGHDTSSMTVQTGASTSPGSYPITITGQSGGTTHTTSATLVVAKPDFGVSGVPSSQTVVQGGVTSYTVSLARTGGFTGSVALSASGLPPSTIASFAPSSLTPGHDSSTLSLNTGTSTPAGTYTVTITGTSGALQHTAAVTVVVLKPDFSIAASPSLQEISQGESTSYTVTLTRKTGFTGAVSLSVAGLPSGATASWSPSSTIGSSSTVATLSVQTVPTTPVGTVTLTISGSGSLPGGPATRDALVQLEVNKSKSFPISGNLGTTLYPGTQGALNLSLTNSNNFDLKVTNLTVAVREATSKAGCSGSQNFAITQFSGTYPLTIHPGTTSLSSLVANSSKWPQVRMLDLPTNQDACKNATISLEYSGSATK